MTRPQTGGRLLAGVELGGTKCVCILGTGPDDIRAQERLLTADPESTLGRIEALLEQWQREHGAFAALGIASFGPLDLAPGLAYIWIHQGDHEACAGATRMSRSGSPAGFPCRSA